MAHGKPTQKRDAATILQLLTPEQSEARFQSEMHDSLGILVEGWFPAGLTAHSGIYRLMPNFYLDLKRFTTHRHWPNGEIVRTDDPVAACNIIGDSTRDVIAALRNDGGINVALTSGNETRMLLGMCRDFAEDVQFFTVEASEVDVARSIELAERFHLKHRMLSVPRASEEDQHDWYARTGYAFGGD